MQILRETNLEALNLVKKMKPSQVLKILETKTLTGRGGGEFPTAKKIKTILNKKTKNKYVVCNADEGEPGTFKDKFILKNNPRTLIEGILIVSYLIKAKSAFIYLRKEYDYLRKDLEKQIQDILKKSESDINITIITGAGSYICGEETAILKSIMGYRPNPSYKPPYPSEKGLWDCPTIVNNVETLTCIPQAILYGDWDPEIRLFSISGEVKHPGLYEFQKAVKLNTILDIVKPELKLKAICFGSSGGILKIKDNLKLDEKTIKEKKCNIGTYGIIFISNKTKILDINLSLAKFYTFESCGKCTPCREGTLRLLNLLKKIRNRKATQGEIKEIKELSEHIQKTSLCGLGQSCTNHILTALENFKEEYYND